MIIKRKDQTLSALNEPGSPYRKTIKKAKFGNVDSALKNFVANASSQGVIINTTLLQEKARDIAVKAGISLEEFSASNGYVNNFKKRNNVINTKIHREAGSIDRSIIVEWQHKLRTIISDFDPKDVFNAHEFGLFWRLQPSSNFVQKPKKAKIRFGKQSKERITVLVCASMLGEKFELIIVGKNENPRGSKQIKNLNMSWHFNSTAWMTGEIFSQVLDKWNDSLRLNSRKIILFVNNCSAHPVVQSYSNILLQLATLQVN